MVAPDWVLHLSLWAVLQVDGSLLTETGSRNKHKSCVLKSPSYNSHESTLRYAHDLPNQQDQLGCLLQRKSKVHEVMSERIVSPEGLINDPGSNDSTLGILSQLGGSLKTLTFGQAANAGFVVETSVGRGSDFQIAARDYNLTDSGTSPSRNTASYFTQWHVDASQEADKNIVFVLLEAAYSKQLAVSLAIGVGILVIIIFSLLMAQQYGWQFSGSSSHDGPEFTSPHPTLHPPPSAHQQDPAVHAPRAVHSLKPDELPFRGVLDAVLSDVNRTQHAPGFSRHCINIANQGGIDQFYDMQGRELGSGSFGSVYGAIHRASGTSRAVKTIAKCSLTEINALAKEIEITHQLDHPNIVRLYECFEDARCIYLVMEVCLGGELFDAIINADSGFSEKSAARLMKQIGGAIFYMHSMGIAHRDLKPENFLLAEDVCIDESALKLIDFGSARRIQPGTPMTTVTYTPYYVAPEVLHGSYGLSCDIWSLGVLLYVLLCGRPPFAGDSDQEILRSVRKGTFSFSKPAWLVVSDDAKDLIQKMLVSDPEKRYSAEQVLNHAWVDKLAPKASNAALSANLFSNLRGFQRQSKFKKAALTAMAKHLGDSTIQDLREMFYALDADGNGTITIQELSDGIKKMGMDVPEDLKRIMTEVDSDGSGEIDYTEFLAATLDRRHIMCEDACWAAFRTFDLDGNGQITKEELLEVFTRGTTENLEEMLGMHREEIEQIIRDADVDGDGEIDFEEFVLMLSGASPKSAKSSRTVVASSSREVSDGWRTPDGTGGFRTPEDASGSGTDDSSCQDLSASDEKRPSHVRFSDAEVTEMISGSSASGQDDPLNEYR